MLIEQMHMVAEFGHIVHVLTLLSSEFNGCQQQLT